LYVFLFYFSIKMTILLAQELWSGGGTDTGRRKGDKTTGKSESVR
jgi:hypothetical protein